MTRLVWFAFVGTSDATPTEYLTLPPHASEEQALRIAAALHRGEADTMEACLARGGGPPSRGKVQP